MTRYRFGAKDFFVEHKKKPLNLDFEQNLPSGCTGMTPQSTPWAPRGVWGVP